MTQARPYSPLFKFACKTLKYYLLIVFGFTVACLISSLLGAVQTVLLILPIAGAIFWRVAGLMVCLFAVTVVVESLRS